MSYKFTTVLLHFMASHWPEGENDLNPLKNSDRTGSDKGTKRREKEKKIGHVDRICGTRICSWAWTEAHLDALLGEISGRALRQIGHGQSGTESFNGSIDGHYSASTLCRNVQVVSNGAGCHLQNGIRRRFIQQDTAKGRQERPRGATAIQLNTFFFAFKPFPLKLSHLCHYNYVQQGHPRPCCHFHLDGHGLF